MDRLGLVVKSNEALLPAVFHSHLSRSIISLLTKTCHGCLMEVATSGKVAVGTRFGGKPFKLNLTGLHTSRFSGLDPKSRVCKSWAAGWGDRNLDHPRLGLPRDQLVHAAVRNQCVG